ncbi:hypothetical protein [Phenylobacterium sp.]|jgi:hypothetical protein|uniref:hypothetical protein n=1 Tax=Phenylobacterium sp. TaxID=1871053 RepID=UPI002E2F353D|nr:hypothetical protein [Phenylobacterium sp.]HEX4711890.1 hypothetical protein [Phenylobacterium sp.]
MIRTAATALAALTLASATAAVAQTAAPTAPPPTPTVVRGTVSALNATSMTVNTDKGPQAVGLTPTWAVAVMKPVAIDAIQPGSFIGTAEMPGKEGTGKSLEVHVFPPGVKMGEGHYGWDLKPGSMMTNGTVGTVVAGKKGSRELDVNYSYGKRHITVPANVPVVQIGPGTRELVKVGTPVFMVVQKTPNGLMAGSVSVGENGAKPPM